MWSSEMAWSGQRLGTQIRIDTHLAWEQAGLAISTRRFLARPSSVLLSATGTVLPYAFADKRAGASIKNDATAPRSGAGATFPSASNRKWTEARPSPAESSHVRQKMSLLRR